jgi:hypothetical protein
MLVYPDEDENNSSYQLNEVRSQKFVVETEIYAPLQQRFPFKGEVLDPAF